MKNNKVFYITLGTIVLIIIMLLVYYFNISSNMKIRTNENLNTNNNLIDEENRSAITSSKVSMKKLTDYKIFFTIREYINNYYTQIVDQNKKEILSLLDEKYISSNKLNESNIIKFINNKYQDLDFYPTMIYAKGNDKKVYYFVQGKLNVYDMSVESLESQDTCIILINDVENQTYSIIPIDYQDDIEYFANDYQVLVGKNIDSNKYNSFANKNISTEYITTVYLNYYKNLLFIDSESAYEMLDDSYYSIYPELQYFTKDLTKLYENFTEEVISTGKLEKNGVYTYSAKMMNDKTIDFTESEIMSFKVKIK